MGFLHKFELEQILRVNSNGTGEGYITENAFIDLMAPKLASVHENDLIRYMFCAFDIESK